MKYTLCLTISVVLDRPVLRQGVMVIRLLNDSYLKVPLKSVASLLNISFESLILSINGFVNHFPSDIPRTMFFFQKRVLSLTW